MLILTHRCKLIGKEDDTLSIVAEARSRPRQHLTLDSGNRCYLRLPRGTILHSGDCLQSEDGKQRVLIIAKPEPILTVTALQSVELLKAAYHLGNRHVALEITPDYLRLSPDPVLKGMLEGMGLTVTEELTPFFPELGAYHPHH